MTGAKIQAETDYRGSGGFPLLFRRTYDSFTSYHQRNGGMPGENARRRALGAGWAATYFQSISHSPGGYHATATVFRPDGRIRYFRDTGGGFVGDADVPDRLVAVAGGWEYRTANDEIETFDASGRLLSISDRAGRTHTLAYGSADAALPSSVTSSDGRQLVFNYTNAASKRLASITVPGGASIVFTYDVNNSLATVTYEDSRTRTYHYELANDVANRLTGISGEDGVRFSTYAYNYYGQLESTEHAGGVEKYTFTDYGDGRRGVVDPLNQTRIYTSAVVQGVRRLTGSNAPCESCGEFKSISHDAHGNVASRTDFKDVTVCYESDSRNLEVARVEGIVGACPANLTGYTPTANTAERKIVTQWHSTFRVPTQIDEAGRRTTFTYDTSGNVLTRTITDFAATPTISRSWTYTYNAFGKVLTEDGPRTDVSDVATYTYYHCTTGMQCGQVHTVTNAAGHVTTYSTYNAHGQPLTITDPNGVVTTLTYDARRRLTSSTVGTEASTFEYWHTGRLKKATMPDGSYLEYAYDPAHRLVDINDADGNRIHYTLDARGNRTAEQAYDPSNALARTRTRLYNSLNRLYQEVGAAGTANVTTTFGYDSNGNQTSVAAPLGRDTAQSYDELNRLEQVTDPLNGVTQYGYNALNQLVTVTDPKGLVTSYSYNALGDLKQQTSPDTGVTTHTYDSGGNLATSTDARNAVSTYTYDALNRVATTSFAVGSTADQTLVYSYDAGAYGKGHLTSVSDSNHSLFWAYDDQGRVLIAGQVVGSVGKTTSYSYANGLRQSMTTPSGQVISYSYTNGKVTSISVNGTPLVSNILYDPFGPVRQWTWSNGSLAVRTYDQDGKVTQIDSEVLKTYSYDDAFRITGITDTSSAALSWTYGYDDLDRLTGASKTGTTLGYTYDANGNRLTQTGSGASTFSVAATSNRLSSTSGALARTYAYDNAGNTTSYTGLTFTYNNRGRMKSSTKNGVTTNYTYNALGQLIKKGGNTLYYYDEAGHILGTYSGNGALVEEIVWLGDIPIVSLRPRATGGINIYNIHTDHLNTPRLITGSVNPGVRWRWDSDPFGGGMPNGNPSGAGVFEFNLRFPGQIHVAETGLNYNYFRDYDPISGRYVKSDPLGLSDGPNTYAYVRALPVSLSDRYGLMSDDDCCSRSQQLGQHLSPYSFGWVICCEGRKVPCAFGFSAPTKGESIRRKCTLKHEQSHLKEIECNSCTAEPTRPSPSGPGYPGYDQSECTAGRIGLTCLRRSLSECGNDQECRSYLQDIIAGQTRRHRGCWGGL